MAGGRGRGERNKSQLAVAQNCRRQCNLGCKTDLGVGQWKTVLSLSRLYIGGTMTVLFFIVPDLQYWDPGTMTVLFCIVPDLQYWDPKISLPIQ